MLSCWLSRVFCDEGMCFYLTESVATNDMFLQYINNKHYKISPCGRNDEAIRAIKKGKDTDLIVTPTMEGSCVTPTEERSLMIECHTVIFSLFQIRFGGNSEWQNNDLHRWFVETVSFLPYINAKASAML